MPGRRLRCGGSGRRCLNKRSKRTNTGSSSTSHKLVMTSHTAWCSVIEWTQILTIRDFKRKISSLNPINRTKTSKNYLMEIRRMIISKNNIDHTQHLSRAIKLRKRSGCNQKLTKKCKDTPHLAKTLYQISLMARLKCYRSLRTATQITTISAWN